jgi:hypothetical protein
MGTAQSSSVSTRTFWSSGSAPVFALRAAGRLRLESGGSPTGGKPEELGRLVDGRITERQAADGVNAETPHRAVEDREVRPERFVD